MRKIRPIAILLIATALLLGSCRRTEQVDPLLRSRADGLNREAFLNRYRDPVLCVEVSQQALQFIADSLPAYGDGALRATNNMAFARYQMADYGGAMQLVETVERKVADGEWRTENSEVELVIARLLKARLLQRQCRIADSYRLLHDIERSGIIGRNRDNMLYSYAQTEYYITMLVLNFHYRNGKEADVRTLLDEVESRRPELRVDYAQDMALNYALAYGWQSAGESITALDYCDDNLAILDLPGAFCTYHYANTLQMMALALKSLPGTEPPDSVLALYDEARMAFFDYCDPYQMIGGTTSTARYALLIGDTTKAHEVLQDWVDQHTIWKPFTAPKMELSLFDVMIRSRFADNADQARRWYEHHCEMQDYITQNEREDFALQQTLQAATRRSHWMTVAAMGAVTGGLLLAVLAVLLWLSRRRLRREKRQLEEAKRRDVERIAGVETALSVMRHDVSPFTSYLRRPDLDPAMRNEILGQLLRTFDNIKNWTSLSVPSGLAFNASTFDVQDVFGDVKGQVIAPHAGVSLLFEPTQLRMHGDRLLMVIMLRNLVNNALQHTNTGSVTVSAKEADGGMVDITVADTGSGMTAGQCEALFRADRELPTGSEHGFGLILCRYIIKKHDDLTRRGCKLWVESTPGKGTAMHCRVAGE